MQRSRFITSLAAALVASAAHAQLPSDITFDGYCDGISDIHFIPGHDGVGGAVVVGQWNRDACHQSRVPMSGITGHNWTDTVTSTFDTQVADEPPFMVRLTYTTHSWLLVNTEGNIVANGTWTEGVPARGGEGRPTSVAGATRTVAAHPDYGRNFPTDLRFDGYCDGITGLHWSRFFGNAIAHGTWNVEACGLPSTPFTSMGDGDFSTRADIVGTYDTFKQRLGYPSLTVEVRRDGTWLYYDMLGKLVNHGTWTSGLPVPGGPISVSP